MQIVPKLGILTIVEIEAELMNNLEFVKSTYFKKEPSLMRKLLLCTPYFFSFKPSWNASPTRSVTL